jgi:protein-S-isoprenylcysteine O-methyltransferase Ste14
MVFNNPDNLFPDLFFANAFGVLIIILALVDYVLPKILERQRSSAPALVKDRWSYQVVYITSVLSLVVGILFRIQNWGISLGAVQYAGLVVIVLGLVIRNWAILKLGQFFSRTVTIEKGHRLVTDGPYRWLRHPAYTGMILMYGGINLALGTWLGALVGSGLVLIAALYRIDVEEKTLAEAFGEEYREYMRRTWRLLPGW